MADHLHRNPHLVLQPLMRVLEKLHLPRTLAALAIIMVVFGSVVGLGAVLSGPSITDLTRSRNARVFRIVPLGSAAAAEAEHCTGA